MKNLMHHAFLVGTFTLNACATLPPAPASAPVPHAANSQNTQNKFPGYRRVVKNGEERFCRYDQSSGSHIQAGMVCYTAEQIRENEDNSRDYLNNVQSSSTFTGAAEPMGGAGR